MNARSRTRRRLRAAGRGALLAAAWLLLSAAGARAGGAGVLPVPAMTIYPEEIIRPGMLRERRFSARFLAQGGFIRRPSEALGKMARRTLVRGRAIPLNALREPYAVRSGKAVRVIYRRGAMTISTLATALSSVSAGEAVAVRNVDTGRVIHGVAQADGTVRVLAR